MTLEEHELDVYREVCAHLNDVKPGLLTSRYGSRRPNGSRVAKARAMFVQRGVMWDCSCVLAKQIHESMWVMRTLAEDFLAFWPETLAINVPTEGGGL